MIQKKVAVIICPTSADIREFALHIKYNLPFETGFQSYGDVCYVISSRLVQIFIYSDWYPDHLRGLPIDTLICEEIILEKIIEDKSIKMLLPTLLENGAWKKRVYHFSYGEVLNEIL